MLKQLIGKTVYYIRYKSNRAKDDGTYYNSNFRELAPSEAAIAEKWKRSRSKGYPKDYFHAPGAPSGVPAGAPVTEGIVF